VAITGPITLTSIWRRKSATGNSSSGPETAMPALLTSPASVSPFIAAPTSPRRRVDRGLVGDVEHQRHEIGAELRFHPIRIGRLAHAAEHREREGRSRMSAATSGAAYQRTVRPGYRVCFIRATDRSPQRNPAAPAVNSLKCEFEARGGFGGLLRRPREQ